MFTECIDNVVYEVLYTFITKFPKESLLQEISVYMMEELDVVGLCPIECACAVLFVSEVSSY